MTLKITLERQSESVKGTRGVLKDGDKVLCQTLEHEWKNNAHKISRILEGTYKVTKFKSPTKGDVFLLHDVPGHDMIEIHVGNTLKDTLGCILVGMGTYSEGIVKSREALGMLRSILPSEFMLEIKSSIKS